MMSRTLGCLVMLVGLGLSACDREAPPPLMQSAAGQSTYAVGYPEELGKLRGEFTEEESRVTRLSGEISAFPSAIETKNWQHVTATYRLADEAGKTEDYGERFEQNDHVSGFLTAEKDRMNQSVAGSVAYVAKQNECKQPGEVAGTAVASWNKVVDKQLSEELRAHDEAHTYISSHAEAIGSKAAEKLRDQADTISELSYTANVATERTRRRMRALIDQSSDVRSTLEKVVREAEEQSKDSAQPEGDRKAAETRARLAKASLERLDSEVSQAKTVDEQLETKLTKLREDYDKAFSALLDATEEKAKASAK
jgi:hypothetical protein